MAIDRRLESTRFPYLSFHLAIGNHSVDVDALLDTGFDGDVAAPAHLLRNGDPPDEYVTWTLADGSEVLAAMYIGTARLGRFAEFPVLITAIGDEPLVGRGVSDRFTLILDHGQRLIVEP